MMTTDDKDISKVCRTVRDGCAYKEDPPGSKRRCPGDGRGSVAQGERRLITQQTNARDKFL